MLGIWQIGAYALGQVSPVNDLALVNGARLPLYTPPTPPPIFQANYWQGVRGTSATNVVIQPVTGDPYVAEDGATQYVAEDGVTTYVQER